MSKEQLFEKTKNLIYKQSWYYSRKYGIDFEELKSESFVIFCKAVEKFQEQKSSFTTYLFHHLRALEYYCKSNLKKTNRNLNLEEFENKIKETAVLDNVMSRIAFNQIIQNLSDDGKELIYNIITKKFQLKDRKKICARAFKKITAEKLKWNRERINVVYKEVLDWFQSNQIYFS